MVEDKNPHELEWMKFEAEWYSLSLEKNDLWDRRATSCTSLLGKYC